MDSINLFLSVLFVSSMKLANLEDAGVHGMLGIPWAGRAYFRRYLEIT